MISLCLLLLSSGNGTAQGWDDAGFWAADLAANTLQLEAERQKLEEFRKTYVVMRDGFRIVRGLIENNNELHSDYFDDLNQVNPVVAKYYKVAMTADLIRRESLEIGRGAPRLLRLLQNTDAFTVDELVYMGNTFDGMREKLRLPLEELIGIAFRSDEDLQMMDSERIVEVDRIHKLTLEIVQDVRKFRRMVLSLAATRTNNHIDNLEALFSVVRP